MEPTDEISNRTKRALGQMAENVKRHRNRAQDARKRANRLERALVDLINALQEHPAFSEVAENDPINIAIAKARGRFGPAATDATKPQIGDTMKGS